MTIIEQSTGREPFPGPIDIDDLRGAVPGRVLVAGDDGYEDAARIWNGAHDGHQPALVVRCAGSADVIAAPG